MIKTQVEALDLISQLGQETVLEYTAESETIDTIVTALLALQGLSPAITKGTIAGAYTALERSIKVDGDSILRALYRLRDTVGGYIYVDNNRALQWAASIGEDKGQQIRYRKNLKGIERSIDYSKLCNKLYAYGAGEGPEAIIKLSDADGYSDDFVEDTTSQGAPPDGWGGIYTQTFIEKSITHPNTLKAWADLKLADVKDPPITYRVQTLDLSQSEDYDFSFEAIQLGSTVTVLDEDIGIDVSTTVVKIEHPDLNHPEYLIIELANRTKDIGDALNEVYDKQQFDSHVATVIGAGQVTINGVVAITDWITGGTTTINGAKITTGTVVAAKMNVSELSAIVADMGTLTAGEILLGTGEIGVGDGFTGIRIYKDGAVYRVAGYNSDTIQAYLDSDGKFKGGGGNVIIDGVGVRFYGESECRFYGDASTYDAHIGISDVDSSTQLVIWANGDDGLLIKTTQADMEFEAASANINMHADGAASTALFTSGETTTIRAGTTNKSEIVLQDNWDIEIAPDGGDVVPGSDGDDLGTNDDYWGIVECQSVDDSHSPTQVPADALTALRRMGSNKRVISLVDVEKERLGHYMRGRVARAGGHLEIEDIDKGTFPPELLDYPDELDISKGIARFNAKMARFNNGQRKRKPEYQTPHFATNVFAEIWFMIRAMQQMADRLEALEVKIN